MTRPHADEDMLAAEAAPAGNGAEKPLDPHVENVRRKLIRFMGVNLGLLFLALMVVIIALVYKSRGTKEPASVAISDIQTPAGGQIAGDIVLPVGATVVSQSLSGNRLSIQAELVDGSRVIYLYDLSDARMIGHFAIRNK